MEGVLIIDRQIKKYQKSFSQSFLSPHHFVYTQRPSFVFAQWKILKTYRPGFLNITSELTTCPMTGYKESMSRHFLINELPPSCIVIIFVVYAFFFELGGCLQTT